ncbi:MAG: family 78 glycoside hydrolase catalytic domain, partial [Planctomycetota bacterium]|nr:family 78 glycoside hydrolase catalytic domain [Planctomycetota bacterium]
MAKAKDKPRWIWLAAACHRENVYLRARRRFVLAAEPVEARLQVTALARYVLYVNGEYVGCGPGPSSAEAPLLDEYAADVLPLKRGANVIAVLAHNPYVGTPRRPRTPGGLWLRLQATYKNGRSMTVVTDGGWTLAPADDFSVRAPRVYWTAGFCEIRDTRREPAGWTGPDFDDRDWADADLVAPKRSREASLPRPRPRSVPRPAERFVEPDRVVGSGRSEWGPGPTAVPFEFAVPDPAHGEFYAATFVHAHRKQTAWLVFDCDESGAVYVNNRLAVRQGYDERFVHWLEFVEHDEYPGLHHGQGHRAKAAQVPLGKGWNSLGVVIYDPGRAWGFALRFEDPGTGKMLPMEYSPDLAMDDPVDWQIIIDQLCPCGKGGLPEVFAPNARTFPDPAQELAWEHRTRNRRHPPGAAAMTADRRGKPPMRLTDSQYVTFDFGQEVVGYVELDVAGPAGAILDLAWAEGLDADGFLDPAADGVRRADRFILRGGRQRIRTVGRRALRYLLAVARVGGKGAVEVHRLGLQALAVDEEADLADAVRTGDRRLADGLALAGR